MSAASQLRWYLGGVSSYFLSGGAQMVLLPWLVAVVLQESAERVGIAQSLAMLPGLLLILVGGATADRSD
jgi:hypothetical protein